MLAYTSCVPLASKSPRYVLVATPEAHVSICMLCPAQSVTTHDAGCVTALKAPVGHAVKPALL